MTEGDTFTRDTYAIYSLSGVLSYVLTVCILHKPCRLASSIDFDALHCRSIFVLYDTSETGTKFGYIKQRAQLPHRIKINDPRSLFNSLRPDCKFYIPSILFTLQPQSDRLIDNDSPGLLFTAKWISPTHFLYFFHFLPFSHYFRCFSFAHCLQHASRWNWTRNVCLSKTSAHPTVNAPPPGTPPGRAPSQPPSPIFQIYPPLSPHSRIQTRKRVLGACRPHGRFQTQFAISPSLIRAPVKCLHSPHFSGSSWITICSRHLRATKVLISLCHEKTPIFQNSLSFRFFALWQFLFRSGGIFPGLSITLPRR